MTQISSVAQRFFAQGEQSILRGGRVDTGPSFKDTLSRALGDVADVQEASRAAINSFVQGEDIEVHEVMAAVEEAGIALDMMVEVRNKMLDAYRTLVGMQS